MISVLGVRLTVWRVRKSLPISLSNQHFVDIHKKVKSRHFTLTKHPCEDLLGLSWDTKWLYGWSHLTFHAVRFTGFELRTRFLHFTNYELHFERAVRKLSSYGDWFLHSSFRVRLVIWGVRKSQVFNFFYH